MRVASSLAAAALGFLGSVCAVHAEDRNVTASDAASAPHPDDIKGQYDLADGRTLTIIAHGRKVLAQIDGHPQTALVPAGGTVFASKDGSFRLIFAQLESGNVTGVVLEEYPGAMPNP